MTVVRSGSATDVGRVRSVNEDRLLESVALFAVADGMGGHVGGEVAARLAIDALQQAFAREPSAAGLVDAVRQANRVVWERSTSDPEVRGMGTTLTAAALVPTADGDRLVVSNVGDSRAYRYAAGELVQMTNDHSVAEELVARGELSQAEAAVHPHRHILTRALGVGPDVQVDAWELAPRRGERFVLCSDGLTNEVSEERIAGVLGATPDPQSAADTLVRLANEHGGNDNVSVVVVDVVVADPLPPDEDGIAVVGDPPAAGLTELRAVGAPRSSAGGTATAGRATPSATALLGAIPSDVPDDRRPGAAASGRTPVAAPVAHQAIEPSATGTEPATAGGADSGPAAAGGAAPVTMVRHVAGALPGVLGRSGRPAAVARERVRSRRVTARVVLFVILLLAVAAGAWALVRYYAEGVYYVGLSGGQVAVFQGRPGGFLGFEPHVVGRSSLTGGEVLGYRLKQLQAGVQEPSRAAAERFVSNLRDETCAVDPTSPACSGAASSGGVSGAASSGGVSGAASSSGVSGAASSSGVSGAASSSGVSGAASSSGVSGAPHRGSRPAVRAVTV